MGNVINTWWFTWLVRKDDGTDGHEFRGTMIGLVQHLRKRYGVLAAIFLTGRQAGEYYFRAMKPAPTQSEPSKRLPMNIVVQRTAFTPPLWQEVLKSPPDVGDEGQHIRDSWK